MKQKKSIWKRHIAAPHLSASAKIQKHLKNEWIVFYVDLAPRVDDVTD